MKTLLYNPIFINPQAYYVFPRLTRYLQPDNESTSEPANYIGTIEVKVIAYGDTTLKRTYTNTDSIDLSEFKNTWIRISLFTKVGSCVLGEWKIGNMESDLPYIDPEVLASLKAVVIVGNKTNNDSDRAIVKNLVDPDNPFVISNAAYTEGSGYADKDSPYYGAFVTDGIDDLITSTKTVQEMLGGSNEITVVSMIHQIGLGCRTNFICDKGSYWRCNEVANTGEGKTGIYGYSSTNISVNTPDIINNVLGDKVDYSVTGDRNDLTPSQFSVVGYISSSGKISYTSSVAWYWNFISNKYLTTDQINQVIAYFNLDRTLKPDILCNVKKQGITNDNHAEFGDNLIDFSGNGRDIQLNNLAWDGDSGIGKYNYPNWKVNVTQGNKYARIVYYDSINGTYSADFKGMTDLYKSYGLSVEIRVNRANTIDYHSIKEDGIYTVTPPDDTTSIDIRFGGENVYNASCDITITQIPSHAGALCLDGVNDFGKVTGMPIYKDYTFIIDYERISYASSERWVAGVVSKSHVANQGAFILMTANTEIEPVKQVYSFGGVTSFNRDDFTRDLVYQSKYKCGDVDLTVGEGVDSNTLWLGTFRDNDQRFFNGAIYSLMSFPYSMSEFLIERQLKKHKLGTLYPDMVEFRPVIKHDDRITAIKYYHIKGSSWINLKPGDYIPIGSKISITTNLKSPYTIANVMSSSLTDIKVVPSAGGGNAYDILGYVTDKSPQKITMDIQVDSSLVQWNPVVESNVPYKSIRYYKLGDSGSGWIGINIGDYIPIGRMIMITIDTANTVDELVSAVSSQLTGIGINGSNGTYNITGTLTSESPQNINITIDEYIRFEDIVQPYPLFFEFTDENGNLISWGGKAKVGNTIIRTKSVSNANILAGLYNSSSYKLNGKPLEGNSYVVEKQMVFTCTTTYLLDNNEPKCILSPSRLRIPNSSYKLLGYIPDISGHGNHGVIHNSAYAEGSGVNEDGSFQFDGVDDFVAIPTLSRGGKQVLMKVNWNTINSIIYDQRGSGGFAIYCSDYNNPSDSITVPAYKGRNAAGTTYIDGIRNEYIIASQLRNVTHNIVEILDTSYAAGNINPIIGKSYMNSNYGSLALYDFMLFDNISTDDKILELNEYVGIEGNTE